VIQGNFGLLPKRNNQYVPSQPVCSSSPKEQSRDQKIQRLVDVTLFKGIILYISWATYYQGGPASAGENLKFPRVPEKELSCRMGSTGDQCVTLVL
jgi:hypothetical protein